MANKIIKIGKSIYSNVILLFFILLFPIVFIYTKELFNDLITSKRIYFNLIVSVGFILFLVNQIKQKKYRINIIDLSIIAFGLYCFIHSFFFQRSIFNNDILQKVFLGIGLFFIIKKTFLVFSSKSLLVLFLLLIISGIIESIIGLSQFFGIIESCNRLYNITGTFYNPIPFAIYISVVCVLSIGLITFFWRRILIHKLLFKGLCLINIGLMFLVLSLTTIRTAWIIVCIGSAVIFSIKYNLIYRLKEKANSKLKKILIIIFSFLSFGAFFYMLYQYKLDSSESRVFIWKTSLEIVKNNLLFGTGSDSFSAVYNVAQGKWFLNNLNEHDKLRMLLNYIKHPFNEFIKIAIEYGILGLVVFLLHIVFLFFFSIKLIREKRVVEPYISIAFAILICYMFSALVSYPFYHTPNYINYILVCAIISSTLNQANLGAINFKLPNYKYILRIKQLIIVVTIGLLFRTGLISFQKIEAYSDWKKANNLVSDYKFKNAIILYEDIYSSLETNGTFLLNYGKTLVLDERFNEGISVLNKAKKTCGDPILYQSLGNAYFNLNQYIKAEYAYKLACNIVPHKLYPKFLLFEFYRKTNQKNKAMEIALIIKDYKIKVPNMTAFGIKKEIERFLVNPKDSDSRSNIEF